MFVEKDWILGDEKNVWQPIVLAGLNLLQKGEIQLLRLPNYMVSPPGNSKRCLADFQKNPQFTKKAWWLCSCIGNRIPDIKDPVSLFGIENIELCNHQPAIYCLNSSLCLWTNNPFLIKKSFWEEEISSIAREDPNGQDKAWFEHHYRPIWKKRPFRVGVPYRGIFQHKEIDG